MDGSDRSPLSPFWMPDPYRSIVINWASYREAALRQGREPCSEEFADLWWQDRAHDTSAPPRWECAIPAHRASQAA